MKIVKDFKRGELIPFNAKYLSSRRFIREELYDGGHPQEWDTRVVEDYYIDTYEIEVSKESEGENNEYQEAAHYNWLDDKFELIEQENIKLKEMCKNILNDDSSRYNRPSWWYKLRELINEN